MITHEQIERAIDLLGALVDVSPATAPDEYDIGHCHYCGMKVRNLHSLLIHHTANCPWKQAREFVEALPSEWDDTP